jgi:hypothetical protein
VPKGHLDGVGARNIAGGTQARACRDRAPALIIGVRQLHPIGVTQRAARPHLYLARAIWTEGVLTSQDRLRSRAERPMHETPQFVKSNLPSDLRKRQIDGLAAVIDWRHRKG